MKIKDVLRQIAECPMYRIRVVMGVSQDLSIVFVGQLISYSGQSSDPVVRLVIGDSWATAQEAFADLINRDLSPTHKDELDHWTAYYRELEVV